MAVTLVDNDLRQPIGELDNSYFPNGDLDVMLQGWLSDAKQRVLMSTTIDTASHNDAAEAWVYYRAYSYIAAQMAARPNTISEANAISVSVGADRPEYWEAKAEAKRLVYAGLKETAEEAEVVASRQTYSVRLRRAW